MTEILTILTITSASLTGVLLLLFLIMLATPRKAGKKKTDGDIKKIKDQINGNK